MPVPTITVTMLGAPGSGKTLFLHGMYAVLSAGLAGYFVYARDLDQDIDIMDVWDLLCSEGDVPPPNSEKPISYQLVLKQGLDAILNIDCVDFRGGAAEGKRDSSADMRQLHDRLLVSDTIYLALDAGKIGVWLANPEVVNRGVDPMSIGRLSAHIQRATEARRAAGKRAPSIVLLLTKCDRLRHVTGLTLSAALGRVMDNLETLVPLVFSKGITALICPSQIGDFGSEVHVKVDPTTVDPVGLRWPFLFSLWYYLNEESDGHNRALAELQSRRSTISLQAGKLRGRFGGPLFYSDRLRKLDTEFADVSTRVDNVTRLVGDADAQARILMADLARLPILRDGKRLA